MASPGTITLVHDKPHNRGTWSPHGHEGWYVMPEILHYCFPTSYIPKTAKERFSDTAEFPPATLTLPRISSKDVATHAAADLTHTLLNPNTTCPLTELGDKQKVALKKLAEIFTKDTPPQETPPPRVHTPEATLDVAPETPLRVNPKVEISFQTGRATRRSPQHSLHIIPDDTEHMPHTEHQKAAGTPKVSQE